MDSPIRLRLLVVLTLLSSSISAQETTNPTTATATATATTTTPFDYLPTETDYKTPSDEDSARNMGGLVNYYFVFLALVLCVAGLAAFLVWRRKKRLTQMMTLQPEQDVSSSSAWGPDTHPRRRYYWQQGRWRSTDVSAAEEGLDEHGEAPPPYMPKACEDSPSGVSGGGGGGARPATHDDLEVPMQALSREQAGLKPPDYVEASALSLGLGGVSTSESGGGRAATAAVPLAPLPMGEVTAPPREARSGS
jgi:hypothetical protein